MVDLLEVNDPRIVQITLQASFDRPIGRVASLALHPGIRHHRRFDDVGEFNRRRDAELDRCAGSQNDERALLSLRHALCSRALS